MKTEGRIAMISSQHGVAQLQGAKLFPSLRQPSQTEVKQIPSEMILKAHKWMPPVPFPPKALNGVRSNLQSAT